MKKLGFILIFSMLAWGQNVNTGNHRKIFTAAGPAPVGKWLIDEGGAATVALDSSGNGNNGTWNGTKSCTGSYYNSPGSGSLPFYGCFDGSTNFIDLGTSSVLGLDRTDHFTISLWINPTTLSPSGGDLISKRLTSAPFTGWNISVGSAGDIGVQLINNFPSNAINTNSGSNHISTGSFQHVCVNYDGSSVAAGLSLFINGSSAALTPTVDTLSSSIATSVSTQIGAIQGTALITASGWEDVRIYKAVVSCATLFTNGPGG